LRGLKRKLAAIDSLKVSYNIILQQGESKEKIKEREEVAKETSKVVSSMRREELAEWIVSALQKIQDEGTIQDTKIEDVSEEEKIEACFRHIYSLQKQQDEKQSTYYAKVFEWHLHSSMSVREAYLLRSSIYCRARCLLQAQMDAKLAVASTYKYYESDDRNASAGGADALKKYKELAQAYYQLGIAYTCEGKEHADADLVQGVKALTQACEYDSQDDDFQGKLKELSEQMTPQQTQQVQELLQEKQGGGYGKHQVFEGARWDESLHVYEIRISVTFKEATRKDFTAGVRNELRRAVAKRCLCESLLEVQLSSIRSHADKGLTIGLEINMKCRRGDSRLSTAQAFVDELNACCGGEGEGSSLPFGDFSEGCEIEERLGKTIANASAAIKDVTETVRQFQQKDNFEFAELFRKDAASSQEDEISIPSRPKTDIELPYKMYRLVHSDGTPCERIDKHGFAMSRVYYSNAELPQEVFVQLCDSSLRWRQSSDEIKVVLLQVPADLKAGKDLSVEISLDFVKCANNSTKEVYFEGQLCRGIIPEQSLWEYESDTGHVTFYLKKMNLELLSRAHQHAEMWWPKLCTHHCEIQWDDYEKDYSDLPPEIMQLHAKNEEQSKLLNNLEYKERLKKEHLQECDDMRKRLRQERLHEMRTGEKLSWVDLSQGKRKSKVPMPIAAQ
jgi:hypothetical protein